MNYRVLFVDDDIEVLNSFRRYFYKTLDIDTASSGEEGLQKLKDVAFVVVVSDYMMPKMNGIHFLTRVKEVAPDTARIMLTGNADIKTAIEAVNEGQIYRFLTKPCPPEVLARAIQAGIEYNHLLTAERVLLEQTLNASISLLVEILSLSNPAAFSRSARIKKLVATIVKKLKVSPTWYYELAATLSQIGFITLPSYLLDKIYNQKSLTEQEKLMLYEHPHVARRLIEKIPRLEIIAQMIEDQDKPFSDFALSTDPAILGAQFLKIAIDYDNLASSGLLQPDILKIMETSKGLYNPQILSLFKESTIIDIPLERRKMTLAELKIGMVIDEDIFTIDNILLAQRGMDVTETVLTRLHNFNLHSKINEPFLVLVIRKN